MKRNARLLPRFLICAALAAPFLVAIDAHAIQRVWNNSSTDFNAPNSWGGDVTGNVAAFATAVALQPDVTAPISVVGLFFNAVSGYDLASSGGFTVTLTGEATAPGAETANADAAAIAATNTSGTNTIDANLNASSASGTSTFYQAGGGTLAINGVVTSSHVSFAGGGTIQLNNANNFTTSSVDGAGATIVVGNANAFGAGPLTVNAPTTFQAGGADRNVSNSVTLAADTTISGKHVFSFTGQVTASGANRTLTVSSLGGASLQGDLFLQESGATGRTFTIAGSSFVLMFANIHDGGSGPATLQYSGSNTLELINPNDYSGGTIVNSGTLVVNGDGRLGLGNLTLTGGGITLTLQSGATNNYIADNASLSIVDGDTVNLNYTGTDVVSGLIINGIAMAPGIYNSSNVTEFFGTGSLTVVPEPATWLNLSLGGMMLLGCAKVRRRHS